VDKMKEAIVELIKPRTIYAFMFYGTYCWLIWKGINPPEPLNGIVLLLLGYYFGNKNADKLIKGDKA